MHQVICWQGIEIVIRLGSVDQSNLDWMQGSPFWRAFDAASVSEGDAVLDLGAHIGSFAVLAAMRKRCRVFAFEPDPDSLSLCKINALLNAVDDRVRCLGAAVGGESGRLMLHETTENWGHTILAGGGPYNIVTGRKAEVECCSLADALRRTGCEHCAFLKFNIEGAEFDMIEKSDSETLRRIQLMVGEVHYDLVSRGSEGMLSRLHDAGFQVHLAPSTEMRAILLATRR
jgi:FkbM family methyltransferase